LFSLYTSDTIYYTPNSTFFKDKNFFDFFICLAFFMPNKKFLGVRYNEPFLQKGFWPPEAIYQKPDNQRCALTM